MMFCRAVDILAFDGLLAIYDDVTPALSRYFFFRRSFARDAIFRHAMPPAAVAPFY